MEVNISATRKRDRSWGERRFRVEGKRKEKKVKGPGKPSLLTIKLDEGEEERKREGLFPDFLKDIWNRKRTRQGEKDEGEV